MSDEFDDSNDNFEIDIPLDGSDTIADQEAIKIDFDQVFQQGILKLALEDDHFCTQLVKYLGNDKDLKNVDFLDVDEFNVIFKILVNGFKKYQRRPSEGQLRQEIQKLSIEKKDDSIVKSLNAALNLIYKTDIGDENFYRENITGYVRQVKFVRSYKKMKSTFLQKGQMEAMGVFKDMLDDWQAVSFEKDTIFKLDDFTRLYEENKVSGTTKIPTGIPKFDRDTLGGIPVQGLTIALAGTNVGKSMFCLSLGCNALRAKDEAGINLGLKVLHVNLEGRINQIIFRYFSNLAQIPYENIARGNLTPEEQARLHRIKNEYDDRFLIKNMAGGFNNTIEGLEAYCKEVYKKFKFNLLIVDYGQLLKTSRSNDEYRHIMSDVFRGLDTMSKAFNCAVISPAQGTRGAQEKQNPHAFGKMISKEAKAPVMQSHDISEAFEIARVADMIISLNATDDEKNQNRLRLFLEKQRDGKKGVTYGLHTRFDLCDLITGSYYDPNATMMRDSEKAEEVDSLDKALKTYAQQGTSKVADTSTPEGAMDELIDLYKRESKLENSTRVDYNSEKRKPEESRSNDIIAQLVQNLQKHEKKKAEIASKAQELIKKINPEATDVLLKEMEKSLKDLEKSGATDEQIQLHTQEINRYQLGIRGKL